MSNLFGIKSLRNFNFYQKLNFFLFTFSSDFQRLTESNFFFSSKLQQTVATLQVDILQNGSKGILWTFGQIFIFSSISSLKYRRFRNEKCCGSTLLWQCILSLVPEPYLNSSFKSHRINSSGFFSNQTQEIIFPIIIYTKLIVCRLIKGLVKFHGFQMYVTNMCPVFTNDVFKIFPQRRYLIKKQHFKIETTILKHKYWAKSIFLHQFLIQFLLLLKLLQSLFCVP